MRIFERQGTILTEGRMARTASVFLTGESHVRGSSAHAIWAGTAWEIPELRRCVLVSFLTAKSYVVLAAIDALAHARDAQAIRSGERSTESRTYQRHAT